MTEGISKERLIELYVENYSDEVTEELLLSECTELDPWLLVDENTPIDRNLHLYSIAGDEGYTISFSGLCINGRRYGACG